MNPSNAWIHGILLNWLAGIGLFKFSLSGINGVGGSVEPIITAGVGAFCAVLFIVE